MLHTITYPRRQQWLPTLGQQVRQWLATLTPPPAKQVQLSPGDSYHLAAGYYRLQVLAGSVWIPEVGIFSRGQQVKLTVAAAGLAVYSYAQQPTVLALRAQ